MQFVSFQLADFSTGAAIPLGKCTVYLAGTSTPAALYDAGGSSISNPVTASSLAQVGFAAADGMYDFQPAYPDGTAAGPKIANQQMVDLFGVRRVTTPLQYGAVGDGVTDDSAAFVAALAALGAGATTGYGYGNSGAAILFVPKGVYYLGSTTLDLTFGVIIEGEGVGFLGPGSTVLKWAAGVTGIRAQAANTTGATGVLGTPRTSTGIPIIRNLLLQSTYSGTESEAHGIHLRSTASIEDVGIFNFAGDGVHILATAGGGAGSEGNANSCHLKRVFAQGCRNGFFIDGADVNAGLFSLCAATANRRWGFWDSSFLGNTYVGCQAQDNGLVPSSPPSVVTNSGNRYCARIGGTWSNAPSGTTADTVDWYYLGVGGASSPNNIAAWSSGTTYRDGGAYHTDDGNAETLLAGCYEEGGQGLAQLVAPTRVLGGNLSIRGSAAYEKPTTDGRLGFPNGIGYLDALGNGGFLNSFGLEMWHATGGEYGLEWLSNGDLAWTVLHSGLGANHAFQLLGEGTSNPVGKRHLNFPNGYGIGSLKEMVGTAAPTSGAYVQGDRVRNSAPTVGQPKAWVCTVAGSPGTWVSEGNL